MTTTVEIEEALRRVGREDDSRIDLAEAARRGDRRGSKRRQFAIWRALRKFFTRWS